MLFSAPPTITPTASLLFFEVKTFPVSVPSYRAAEWSMVFLHDYIIIASFEEGTQTPAECVSTIIYYPPYIVSWLLQIEMMTLFYR